MALEGANIDPDTKVILRLMVQYPMGDPIEFKALNDIYSSYTKRKQFCAIGSVKGNIGHADTAAGIAGLIKVLSFIVSSEDSA